MRSGFLYNIRIASDLGRDRGVVFGGVLGGWWRQSREFFGGRTMSFLETKIHCGRTYTPHAYTRGIRIYYLLPSAHVCVYNTVYIYIYMILMYMYAARVLYGRFFMLFASERWNAWAELKIVRDRKDSIII